MKRVFGSYVVRDLMIDAAIKEQLKVKLLKEEERLKHELSQFTKRIGGGMGYAPEFPNLGTSEEDSSFEVQEYTLNVDLQRKLEKDLGLVRKALRKTEEGGYGSCEGCGNMIALERLHVIPEAQYCSDCFGK